MKHDNFWTGLLIGSIFASLTTGTLDRIFIEKGNRYEIKISNNPTGGMKFPLHDLNHIGNDLNDCNGNKDWFSSLAVFRDGDDNPIGVHFFCRQNLRLEQI